MFDFSYNRVIQTVQTSLERFGVEYIDLVQVHDLEFALDLNQIVNETLPALHEMVKQGKVRWVCTLFSMEVFLRKNVFFFIINIKILQRQNIIESKCFKFIDLEEA